MKKLLWLASVCTVSLLLYMCSLNGSEEDIKEYPESIVVSGEIYNQFYNDWVEFSESLSANQIELLNDFTHSFENEGPGTNGRVADAVKCNCLQGQTHCEAIGTYSECCICCSSGRSATCGTLGGLASCKCEDPEIPGMEGRVSNEISDVTVFPRRVYQLLLYASQKQIDTKEITMSFELLVNYQ